MSTDETCFSQQQPQHKPSPLHSIHRPSKATAFSLTILSLLSHYTPLCCRTMQSALALGCHGIVGYTASQKACCKVNALHYVHGRHARIGSHDEKLVLDNKTFQTWACSSVQRKGKCRSSRVKKGEQMRQRSMNVKEQETTAT